MPRPWPRSKRRARTPAQRQTAFLIVAAGAALLAPALRFPAPAATPTRAAFVDLSALIDAHPRLKALGVLEAYRAFLAQAPAAAPLPDPMPFTLPPFPTPAPQPLLTAAEQRALVEKYLGELEGTLRGGIQWRMRELRDQWQREAAARTEAFGAERRTRLRGELSALMHARRDRLTDLRLRAMTLRSQAQGLAEQGQADLRVTTDLRAAEEALAAEEAGLQQALDAAAAAADLEIEAYGGDQSTGVDETLRARIIEEELGLASLLKSERTTLLGELTAPAAVPAPELGGTITVEPGPVAAATTKARAAQAQRVTAERASRPEATVRVQRLEDRLLEGLRAEVRAQVEAWARPKGYRVQWAPGRGVRDVTGEALTDLTRQWQTFLPTTADPAGKMPALLGHDAPDAR